MNSHKFVKGESKLHVEESKLLSVTLTAILDFQEFQLDDYLLLQNTGILYWFSIVLCLFTIDL